MEECPSCKKWMLTYEPQGEVHRCGNCGFVLRESYDNYIKRNDCAKDLVLNCEKTMQKEKQR